MKKRIKESYKKLRSTNILSNFFNLSSIQISNLLLIFITIRIITGNVGIEGFGLIMFAYRFSTLAGTIINYGTSQSGIRDVAFNLSDTEKLGALFYNILFIRAFIFLLFVTGLFIFYWFHVSYYNYILLALPVVLAEVFNPLYFFIGIEKIRAFNICNLILNIVAVITILFFIKNPHDAVWVNFILGTGNVITYSGLLIYLIVHYKLYFRIPLNTEILRIGRDNFYITVNNISANLQQSVIIFALKWSNSDLLGAYTLCDRVIGQCRNLLNIVSNAIYPNAAAVYQKGVNLWNTYRKKMKYLFAGIFFTGALIIFTLADFIIFVLSKQHDANAVIILRVMAFVPVVSGLNVFSVLDLLLKNNSLALFKIALLLIVISAIAAFTLASTGNALLIAAFTLIIELSALCMYEYFIKKPSTRNA